MEAKWEENLPQYEELKPFEEGNHVQVEGDVCTIKKCLFSEEDFQWLFEPKDAKIVFDQVIFIDSPGNTKPPRQGINFRFDRFPKSILFKNCIFDTDCYMLYDHLSFSISHTVFRKFAKLIVGEGCRILIKNSKLYLTELDVRNQARVIIVESWFRTLTISNLRPEEKSELSSRNHNAGEFRFDGYVEQKLVFDPSTRLNEVAIKYDCLDCNVAPFGEIHFAGGKYSKRITLQAKHMTGLNDDQQGTAPHKIWLKKLRIDFNSLEAGSIRCGISAISVLHLRGRNIDVPCYFGYGQYGKIHLDNYMQSQKGTVILRGIPSGEPGPFLTGKREILVENSIVNNDQFYFQSCNLQSWESSFPNSFFQFKSLSSRLPELSPGKASIEEQLNTVNTILRSTGKEDDIINWYELKQKQQSLTWRKNKNRLSVGQYVQWLTQLINNYGTDWVLPFSILTTLNVTFAALITLFVSESMPASSFLKIYWFGDVINRFYQEFAISFIPTFRFDNHLWPRQLWIFLVVLKVFNAVLIVQMVSAFRVYFKR